MIFILTSYITTKIVTKFKAKSKKIINFFIKWGGASIPNIVLLLSKEFTKWVLLACVFALPLAYYAMNQWLKNFAYRTSIGVKIFVLSALIAALIAVITVSYQSVKTAVANPVDSLRYE